MLSKIYSFFVLINLVFAAKFHSTSEDLLCKKTLDVEKFDRDVVVILENSKDPMIHAASLDTLCWIKKIFDVTEIYNSTKETVCYHAHSIYVKPGNLLIVISEGGQTSKCPLAIYGPVPNVIYANNFVIQEGESSYLRTMELIFRNTGGFVGLTIDLQRDGAASRIKKILHFYLQNLDVITPFYKVLIPWWKPIIRLPPDIYLKYRQEKMMKKESGAFNSTIIMISCIPMLTLAIGLSLYLVIHPRSALKYSDEEIDFEVIEFADDAPTIPPNLPNLPIKNPPAPQNSNDKEIRLPVTKTSEDIKTNSTMKSEKDEKLKLEVKNSHDTLHHKNSSIRLAPVNFPEIPIDKTPISNK